jgi:putative ABC transport system substrate-binding protein
VKRRELITLLGAAAAWPLAAHGQQPAMPVVGILHMQTQESEAARLTAIRRGLQEAGFVEGQNMVIENRFADGQSERLPMLTTDLVRLRVAVLLASTTPPALAAKAATPAIPIVFVLGVDPVELGLVASLNHPDVNVTGVTFLVQQLVAKRLELLCEVVPTPAPIGMLADQGNPNADSDVRNALGAAAALGRTLHFAKIAAASDIEPAIATLMQQRVSAVFVAPHANFRIWRPQLLSLMERHALPASFSSSDFVTAGGLMSYGPDQFDSYREAGVYVGRILKGERPADLPVMQSTKFEFAINLKTAKALGVKISDNLLTLADEVSSEAPRLHHAVHQQDDHVRVLSKDTFGVSEFRHDGGR